MTFNSLVLINLIIIFVVFVSNVMSLNGFLYLNCICHFLRLSFVRLDFCHDLNNAIFNDIKDVMFNVDGLLMICFMKIMSLVLIEVNAIEHLLVSFFAILCRSKSLICYDISKPNSVHSIF